MFKTLFATLLFSLALATANAEPFGAWGAAQSLNLRMDNGLSPQNNNATGQQTNANQLNLQQRNLQQTNGQTGQAGQPLNSQPFNMQQLNAMQRSVIQDNAINGNTNNLANQPYQAPQQYDYTSNLFTDVFGANLFTGAFAKQGATQFNPNYVVAVGDQIQVRFWGAFTFEDILTVDPQGNIFIPHAGPVKVLGVKNNDLQKLTEQAVKKVFKTNVFSYASLAAAQPVRVLVSGNVYRPGLYRGTSMDSLLHYLDQAGGIDVERGSFLSVIVKRGEQVRFKANLYDFLIHGNMPLIQLADGDVIFVSPRGNTVRVIGLADNAKRFEFDGNNRTISELITLAKPKAEATHIRIIRNTGTIENVEYYPINEANNVLLQNGDAVEFTADKRPGTITVRVQGEHQSQQEYVLPYGSKIKDILPNIEFTARSEQESLQLFRLSVKERQKQQLDVSLKTLESTILTARSETDGEAAIRKADAELLTQWITIAKEIQPLGQVAITNSEDMHELLLENGDIINVPTRDGLVLIGGEVLFPNAIAFHQSATLNDYINKAGGYTQNADVSRIIIAKRDGTFVEAKNNSGFKSLFSDKTQIVAGDQILILPKVDIKSRQLFKEVVQIASQLAITARVVFGL